MRETARENLTSSNMEKIHEFMCIIDVIHPKD